MEVTFSSPVFLAAGAVLVLSGAVLLKTGLFPRRRGDMPRCRGCGYILVGNTSGRCPECGRELTGRNVVVGERQRRTGRAIGGAALLLTGLLMQVPGTVTWIRTVDWYRYRADSWVLSDLQSGNTVLARRAFAELDRRQTSGGLSRAAEQRLIELALQEQAAANPGPLRGAMLDYLGERCVAGRMSSAQSRKFLSQLTSVQLFVRPWVVVGEGLPCRLAVTGRCPAGRWEVDLEFLGAALNGAAMGRAQGRGIVHAGTVSTSYDLKTTAPGRHTVRSAVRLAVRCPSSTEAMTRVLLEEERSATAEVEVLAAAPPGAFTLIHDASLQAPMQACVSAECRKEPRQPPQVTLQFSKAPVNVAFEVFVRAGEKETPLESVCLGQGESCNFLLRLPADVPREFDLILRSSERAARRSTDLFTIWSGQITLMNVRVETPP